MLAGRSLVPGLGGAPLAGIRLGCWPPGVSDGLSLAPAAEQPATTQMVGSEGDAKERHGAMVGTTSWRRNEGWHAA